MDTPGEHSSARRWGRPRRLWLVLLAIVIAGLVAFALTRLELSKAGHTLVNAQLQWVALALVLMGTSLVFRAISWHEVLRAALPDTEIRWPPVIRATMIGVMASAIFPGRLGEPTRVLVITRRIEGRNRHLLPIVAGTVFSQTLINLIALAILAAVTLTGAPFLRGHAAGIATAVGVPLLIAALIVSGPRVLALAQRARWERIRTLAVTLGRGLTLARQGLVVFTRPGHGTAAVASQLFAWALQWLACYVVLLALNLQSQTDLVTAAAILLAVNLSAVLPATPSNVGVFQAACLVVLAAYGVNAGPALAYGILLQAVEVVTALLLGVPAVIGEGISWRDIRDVRAQTAREEEAELPAAEEARPVSSAGERAQ